MEKNEYLSSVWVERKEGESLGGEEEGKRDKSFTIFERVTL
jgi:hypothetical protein